MTRIPGNEISSPDRLSSPDLFISLFPLIIMSNISVLNLAALNLACLVIGCLFRGPV